MNFTLNNFGYQPAAIEFKITNKINAYLYFMTVQIIWNEWEALMGRKKYLYIIPIRVTHYTKSRL